MATESNVDWIDDNAEWETIGEESGAKLEFANVGESFTGKYLGTVHIAPQDGEEFDQQRFTDKEGQVWAINGGYKIREAMEKADVGDIVRITYVGEIDTGQPSPMKDYRVEVAKKPGSAPKAKTTEG